MKRNEYHFPPEIGILQLPTPVQQASEESRLWIKRDDLTARPYGGNKPRKLDFLLADAREKCAGTLVTTGGTGSNHCLATTVYGLQCGFDVKLILFPQPETDVVRHRLATYRDLGAELIIGTEYSEFETLKNETINRSKSPYFIPAGGSNGLGCQGFIKAGFELADQINSGICPLPDMLICAAGTLGTLAGLVLGLRIAGLNFPVRGIRVVDDIVTNETVLESLIDEAGKLFVHHNPDCNMPGMKELDVEIVDGFFGDGYGQSTVAGDRAILWMERCGDVTLEPTYTAKTMAGVLSYLNAENFSGRILYWHTFDSGYDLSIE